MRNNSYDRFPGRHAVLRALAEDGGWTASQAFGYARSHGGSTDVYEALDHHVRHGRLTYSAGGDAGIGTWRLT